MDVALTLLAGEQLKKMYSIKKSYEMSVNTKLMLLVLISMPTIASSFSPTCDIYVLPIEQYPADKRKCSRPVVRYTCMAYVSVCRLPKSHICPLLRTGKALPLNPCFYVPS